MLILFWLPALAYIKSEEKIDLYVIGLAVLQIPISLPYLKWIDDYLGIEENNFYMSYNTILINIIIIIITMSVILEIIVDKLRMIQNHMPRIRGLYCGAICICVIYILSNCMLGIEKNDYDFSGRGTKDSPYLVRSTEDFEKFLYIVNSGDSLENTYFQQTNDLYFEELIPHEVIGAGSTGFAGIYDGGGYSINNYVVEGDDYAGIFSVLSGRISNLEINNCSVRGGICGSIAYEITSQGAIINCSVNGVLIGCEIGGIAAVNEGLIENSVAIILVDNTLSDSVIQNGVANSVRGSTIVNSYTNLDDFTENKTSIDQNTLDYLIEHVNNNNCFYSRNKIEMCTWTIENGYFALCE